MAQFGATISNGFQRTRHHLARHDLTLSDRCGPLAQELLLHVQQRAAAASDAGECDVGVEDELRSMITTLEKSMASSDHAPETKVLTEASLARTAAALKTIDVEEKVQALKSEDWPRVLSFCFKGESSQEVKDALKDALESCENEVSAVLSDVNGRSPPAWQEADLNTIATLTQVASVLDEQSTNLKTIGGIAALEQERRRTGEGVTMQRIIYFFADRITQPVYKTLRHAARAKYAFTYIHMCIRFHWCVPLLL